MIRLRKGSPHFKAVSLFLCAPTTFPSAKSRHTLRLSTNCKSFQRGLRGEKSGERGKNLATVEAEPKDKEKRR
jgi:hypothetical protein